MLRKRSTSTSRIQAFTLIELLVVVGIIAVLVSILVPALFHAKVLAKNAATKAQMQSIARAAEQYYTDFNGYPGPVDDTLMDGTTPGATVKFSGAQNLFLGLTRRFYPLDPTAPLSAATPPDSATTVPGLPATNQIWFDNDLTKQQANYAVNNPFGALTQTIATAPPLPYDTYPAFLLPKATETSNATHSARTVGAALNQGLDLAALPCFVDAAYGADSRPILYYRQSYKWDSENAALGRTTPANIVGTPWATNITLEKYIAGGSGQACFYSATNSLVDATVPTTTTTPPLSAFLSSDGTNIGKPVGAFVLISPGTDRVYGSSDDIVVVGGQ